jgi:predicted DNA binding CopG/RHH family protein
MSKLDEYELEVLEAYEEGRLKSVATKTDLAKLRRAARATAIKDRRVNIRLSAGDLRDIQVKALEEVLALPDPHCKCATQVRYPLPSRAT